MISAVCLVLISFYEIQVSELVYFLSETNQLQQANIYSVGLSVSLPTVSPSEHSLEVSVKQNNFTFLLAKTLTFSVPDWSWSRTDKSYDRKNLALRVNGLA